MKVISNDGQEFEIDHDIAKQSTLLKPFSDEGADGPFPLPNVKGSILKPPIDDDDDDDPSKDIYEPKRSDGISEWDYAFMQQFNAQEGTLFDIIMAANYLGIKSLLAVGCKTVANLIRDKSSSEVREMFNISDLPPENVNESTMNNNGNELAEAVVSNDTTAIAETETDSLNK